MTILLLMSLFIQGSNKIITGYSEAPSKNLFNKTNAISGKYVNWDNGNLLDNPVYAASEFIPVVSGQSYIINKFNRGIAYYNKNKEFISGHESPPSTVTVPENCYYMRVTPYKIDIDSFTTYKKTVEIETLTTTESFELSLPSEILVAVDRTIELYNNQVAWTGNIDNYHFKWDCKIGKAMNRKFSITGEEDLIGDYPLTLTVYDNNMKVVATSTSTIKIISKEIGSPKTILTIGDSLTNNKAWLEELQVLSSDRFTMVGTRGIAPLKHEGRSGWSAGTYLTGISYDYENEGINPFWDGTRFNWNYYKTQTGIKPDAIQIYLGTNGMELDPTSNGNNIKKMVDYIRQDDANIPIFIVNTIYRGNQDGIGNEVGTDRYAMSKGNWKLEEDRKVFNLMVKLDGLMKDYPNLHFVPISICHDSEYNFGAVETPVNPRAIQTELLAIQATHPQEQGYLQMADIMFSVFAKYLNN